MIVTGRHFAFQGERWFFVLTVILICGAVRESTAKTAENPLIFISDTSCSCSTPSRRLFDCKSLLHKTVQLRSKPDGRRRNTASHMREAVKEYLDSTGHFYPSYDTLCPEKIKIRPGPRFIIRTERVVASGADSLPDFTGGADIGPASYPRPYDAAWVGERATQIGRILTARGYPFVTVSISMDMSAGRDTVEMLFYVESDKLYRFAPPLLTGEFSTRRRLLLGDISIEADSLFDHNKIEQSIARLKSRPYITSATAPEPFIASEKNGIGGRIVAPISVTDRSGLGLDGALGLDAGEGEKPEFYGDAEFSFINLFHAGEEASLSYEGDKSGQRLDIGYGQPRLFSTPLGGGLQGGLEVENESYAYLYGSLGLTYEPALLWRLGVKLRGHKVSHSGGLADSSGTYAGADFIIARNVQRFRDGMRSTGFTLTVGGGLTNKERMYSRTHIDFTTRGQLPLPLHTAFAVYAASGHIITRESALVASEIYRVGGSGSLRGYGEDEYAFRTVLSAQAEFLYYFQSEASVYLFTDVGAGFTADIRNDRSYRKLAGYGLGVRLPAATIGSVAVEWARNISDKRSPGRIHVRVQNQLSSTSSSGFPLISE